MPIRSPRVLSSPRCWLTLAIHLEYAFRKRGRNMMKQLLSRARWAHVRSLSIALAMVIGLCRPAMPAFAVPQCGGSGQPSCDNQNPNSMQCTATNSADPNPKYNGSAKIERRVSNDCNANWTRVTNTSSTAYYVGASIRFGGSNYDYHRSMPSGGKIGNGQYVYTYTVSPRPPTIACGQLTSTTPSLPLGGAQPQFNTTQCTTVW